MNTCRICQQQKPLADFYMRRPGVPKKECKACAIASKPKGISETEFRAKKAAITKQWQQQNPERLKKNTREWYMQNVEKCRNSSRKHLYAKIGATLEDYDRLFAAQQGCCAICGLHQSNFTRQLALDHDHETRKLRGLLCNNCNRGIGHLKDDVAILTKAIEYLTGSFSEDRQAEVEEVTV